MSISITIRDVPDDTRDELAARAGRSGRSLQEYLRHELIRIAGRPDPEDWVARVQEQKRRIGTPIARDELLEYLDADRR